MVAKNGYRIIDADGHIIEPKGMWAEYIDPEFRDRAPRSPHPAALQVGDRLHPRPEIDHGGPEAARAVAQAYKAKYGEGLYSADPDLYLRNMDREGIDQAVIYPTQGLFAGWDDKLEQRYAVAVVRAYNNWLHDFCQASPRRLFGAAMIALQDVELAVREARRAVKDLGMKAIFVRPNPVLGRNLDDPAYDPLYAEI